MSLLDNLINVNITRQTKFPTRAGFGIPLLLAYHTRTANMVDTYTDTDAMLTAGFAVTDRAYQMAAAAFSQNPKPTKIILGRRTSGPIMIVKIIPKNFTAGFVYAFQYEAPDGTKTAISYTVLDGDDASDVNTALNSQINALGGSSSAVSGGGVVITAAAAGAYFDLIGLPAIADMTVENQTLDATVVTQYNAVKAVDASTWFGVVLDSNAPAEVEALAAQIETERKVLLAEVSDSECADNAVTTDTLSALKAASYANTTTIFSQNRLLGYRATGWLSKGLALGAGKPGGNNWAYLTIGGNTVDSKLSDGDVANIQAKFGNVYVEQGGLGITLLGMTAAGEFIDIVVGSYWLQARLQERVLGALYNNSQAGDKIPYTDDGVQIVCGLVLAQLGEGVKNNFLAKTPKVTCTGPKVADVDPAERADRHLPGVKFTATLAGAINKITMNGTLSV
jgi:hypothetical protein